MSSASRRILLFLACAAVLLTAGYFWGSSQAHNQFYSPEASLDRELVHLDFNGRVLHFVNQAQPEQCRRELATRLQQQITFAKSLLGDASPEARQDAERRLGAAEVELGTASPRSDATALR